MSRIEYPHSLSDAPWTLWAYFVVSLGQATVGYVGSDVGPWWFLLLPVSLVFSYFLLRGLRTFWRLAIALQILNTLSIPAEGNELLRGLLIAAALILLFVPPTRDYFPKAPEP